MRDESVPSGGSPAESGESARESGRLGGQFLASLNHDIRTPLSGIMGMTDLLLETELNDEQGDYVNTVRLCAEQLHEMLNAALEYTALADGAIQVASDEFHLCRNLEALIREFQAKAEAKGIELRWHWDGLPEYVVGDAVRLRQALAPLLSNAVKFTHAGEIVVGGTAGRVENGTAEVTLSVRDTGIGIPPDRLAAVFDAFRQLETGLSRTYPGMGLGLAVARKLAALMGGRITVESEPGSGSTFRLTVPLSLPRGAEPESLPAPGTGAARHRVLFVDDNDVARRIVAHLLAHAGYHIECAEGGREGIDAAARRRFDLILMDLQMPGVNGLEATLAIRRLPGYSSTPILALSANYSEDFIRRCQEAGLQGFLPKPIQRQELLKALAQHLA